VVSRKPGGATGEGQATTLARVLGNSPDFWLNVQRRSDLREAMHSPRERERIKRARRLTAA
jgi:plasmid maintenance system antidote protein VapI